MAVVMVALIYPLAKVFGLWGGQLACLIAVLVGYLLQVERIRKITGLRLWEYGKNFLIPALVSLVIAGLWLAAGSISVLTQPAPNIILGILGCLLACVFAWALSLSRSGEAV